ncbi:MAG: thioredoxin [Chromatiaceae bacterium]|jgi:putative thioredoxin|nr:thioredoxin [Chromatiaceae bacterium]
MANSPFIVTATAETFDTDVLDASYQRPVLVDFWADWCAPCRMLMPILAKLADAYGGRFLLAKVNTDEERELAAQFGIRSLPTVQLFKNGQPVDQFMGALPESQVREFLDRHLPRESDKLLARAEALLRGGDLAGAAKQIGQARAKDPANARIQLAEARIKAASGDVSAAQGLLDRLPLELLQDPEAAAVRAQVAFAGALTDAPPETQLAARLQSNPRDSDARYRLAAYRVAEGDFEGALDQLLELLKKDRAYGEDAARKGMVMIFDLLGGDSELVTRYRAKMLSALY